MYLTTGQLAKKHFVTNQTIINWIKAGKYERYERTKGGHFRVWEGASGAVPRRVVLYARVSSAKQRSSIATQERILRAKYPNADFVFDIGSGFNFKRPRFKALLESILRGNATTIVVATKDRLCRAGGELLQQICDRFDSQIEALDCGVHTKGGDAFGVEYLVAYLTSFCNSNSGRRAAKRRTGNTGNTGTPEETS